MTSQKRARGLRRETLSKRALRPALVYLLLGLVWIIASDALLKSAITDVALLSQLQTAKGWAFVGLSSFVMYILVRHEIREAEDAERRFRALVEQSLAGVCVIQGGRFSYVNPHLAEMFGNSSKDLLCLPNAEDVFIGAHRSHFSALVARADPSCPQPPVEVDWDRPRTLRVRATGAHTRPVEVALQPIEWRGRPAVIGVILDRSEQEALEEQLRHSQRMEAIGQLTGAIAHDFNNVLTAITIPLELALMDVGDGSPVRADMEESLRAAKSAAQLTRQLLTFSRKEISRPRALDINKELLRLKDMLSRLSGESVSIELELNDLSGVVFIDPSHVEQVVMNLVVNAADAMPDGGRITIRTSEVPGDRQLLRFRGGLRPGAHVVLEVSDTGHGMDRATQLRAFEPYYTTKEKGTGLGLSTVFGIARQADGFVRIDSEPGRGTSMYVYLPVLAGSSQAEATTEEEGRFLGVAEVKASEKTLLVVEDDAAVQKVLARTLRREGFQVLLASEASEALAFATGHKGGIDLLVTDLILPGMDGVALGTEVRKHRPGIPVLYSSGYSEEEVNRRLKAGRGLPFIAKPCEVHQLIGAVRQALASTSEAQITPPPTG